MLAKIEDNQDMKEREKEKKLNKREHGQRKGKSLLSCVYKLLWFTFLNTSEK